LQDDTEPGRPYERLLPWWQIRAEALEGFQRRRATEPTVLSAAEPADLQTALKADGQVTLFGAIQQVFLEPNGDTTVLFQASDKRQALRVVIPAKLLLAHARVDLLGLQAEYRQNYLYVEGKVTTGPRGPMLESTSAAQWQAAKPDEVVAEDGTRQPVPRNR
jgi:hypothetical protein